jgi:hypothetical protein
MKTQLKKLLILVCLGTQTTFAMQQSSTSVYNNARLIFHALGPKFHLAGLEGIDPSVSITAMETTLTSFIEKKPDITPQMKDRIAKAQKSLAKAKTNYLICIDLVNKDKSSVVNGLALQLSQDAKKLTESDSNPSILFIGGHYLHPKGGSLGGHTASYDTIRQNNGKLSFIVHNTVKAETHTIDGNQIQQLIYTDLEETDLDKDFWENVIQTNYMNPVKGRFYMESFYEYLDRKLNKGSNKIAGRSYNLQEKGVCAWKSISVWLHGKIAPGQRMQRDASHELTYVQYKRLMFENMLANFKPDSALDQDTAVTLKTELENKIQKMDEKSKLLAEGKIPNSSTTSLFSWAAIWKFVLGN